MRWDYDKNLPVEGTYKYRGFEWDDYLLSGKHHELDENDIKPTLDQALIDLVGGKAVCTEMEDFILDHLNGVIELFNHGESHWKGRRETITDADVYARLYFCDTETDVFDMIIDGTGDASSLIETFGYVEPEEPNDYSTPRETASQSRLKRFEDYLLAHDYPREGNVIWDKLGDVLVTGRLVKLEPYEMVASFTRAITLTEIVSKPLSLPSNGSDTFAVLKDGDYILTKFGRKQMIILLNRLFQEERLLYSKPELISSPGPALAMDLTPSLQEQMKNISSRLFNA